MSRMRGVCPQCQAAFDLEAEPGSFFICPVCGAKLKSRGPTPNPTNLRAVVARFKVANPPPGEAATNRDSDRTVRIDLDAAASATPKAEPPATPSPPAPPATEESAVEPGLGPDSPLPDLMHALYEMQKRTLELVRSRLGPATASAGPQETGAPLMGEGFAAYPAEPTRARRRKTVLLVDDDEAGREPAMAALKQAKIPVRTAADGREALAAISTEAPDIIVLEPKLSSEHGLGDLLAKVKSRAEWSVIPIVLYMRDNAQSQKLTRATYGADRLILKGPRGPAALVSQVITLFRGA
jgi:CheY-like chemotaxis protein